MANLEVCTLYDRKNRTNSYNFLRIKRLDALLLSVSLNPIFVDFTLLIDMLSLSEVFYCHRQICTFIFEKNIPSFFYRSIRKTILIAIFGKMKSCAPLGFAAIGGRPNKYFGKTSKNFILIL